MATPKGLFAAESPAGYARAIGRDVRADEVQAVLNELMAAKIVMRRGHGLYGLTDPHVQEIWRARHALMRPPGEGGGRPCPAPAAAQAPDRTVS